MPQIKQIDAPVPLGVIDHEAIQLGVPRTNGLVRELKTEGGIRLRK
jgi:hypothetical protein